VERALRIFVLTIDDLARLVQAAFKFRRRDAEPATTPPRDHVHSATETVPWLSPGRGDMLSLSFAALCLVLIVISPSLTGTPVAEVTPKILQELSPLK
jgi:hypothetical protein